MGVQKFRTLICGLLLVGCAAQTSQTTSHSTSAALAPGGARVNPPSYCMGAAGSKPARMCGQDGYTYLLKSYIRSSCSGCHSAGNSLGLAGLADADPATAFSEGRFYTPATWIERVTHNEYVKKECNLLPTDAIYADLSAWTQHSMFCD